MFTAVKNTDRLHTFSMMAPVKMLHVGVYFKGIKRQTLTHQFYFGQWCSV